MEEKREKIQKKEFKRFKEIINFDADIILGGYLVLFLKENGFSFNEINPSWEYSEDEIRKEMNKLFPESYGKNVSDLSTKEFLNKYCPKEFSEVIESKFNQIIIEKDSNARIMELINKYTQEIEDFINKTQEEISQKISEYDLSDIPAEEWYDIKETEMINFENTGANIDMNNMISRICNSLKGCNLISFNPDKYYYYGKDEFGWDGIHYGIKKDFFDKEQYQTILDGYKTSKKEFTGNDFLEDYQIQKNNIWLIDRLLDINKENMNPTRIYQYESIWRNLSPEIKSDTKYDKVFNFFLENLEYDMIGISGNIRLEKNFDIIIQVILNKEKEIPSQFYYRIWEKLSLGVQDKYFEEILKIGDIEKLLSCSDRTVLSKKLDSIIDLTRNSQGIIDERKLSKYINCAKGIEISDEQLEKIFSYNYEYSFTLKELWENLGKETQRRNISKILKSENIIQEDLWNATNIEVRKEKYEEILKEYTNPEDSFTIYLNGKAYLDIIKEDIEFNRKEEKKRKIDSSKFLRALRIEETGKIQPFLEKDKNYEQIYLDVLYRLYSNGRTLTKENIDTIIDNLPRLGEKLITNIVDSNSTMIRDYSNSIIIDIAKLPKDEAERRFKSIENIFGKNLPSFVKLYKYFDLMVNKDDAFNMNSSKMSPVLRAASTKKGKESADSLNKSSYGKKIIFSDLFKIAVNSNNKSLSQFLDLLEDGNEIFKKHFIYGVDLKNLSSSEISLLREYTDSIYYMYENSASSRIDEKHGNKIQLSGNLEKDLTNLAKRYSRDGKIIDLPDLIWKSIIGPDREMFDGLDSIKKIKDAMKKRNIESNEYHERISDRGIITTLPAGTMVKGIRNGLNLFPKIVKDGIRAGEYLGSDNHTDATPLDTDFGVVRSSNTGRNLKECMESTSAFTSCELMAVIEYDPKKISYDSVDNKNLEGISKNTEELEKVSSRFNKDEIRRKVSKRISEDYEKSNLEAFQSGVIGSNHYGIRTGVSISDVSYFVTRGYDKRMGYELAMNGTYIPIVDYETGKVIFTKEMYKEIRDQMKGLSYYKTEPFQVDDTAVTKETKRIVAELYPDSKSTVSSSQIEAKKKRDAIVSLAREALKESLGLDLIEELSRNMSDGFVEFIDTGSTGRGTNLPGDGDFDFSVKIDNSIMKYPDKMEKLRDILRKQLAIKSDDPESSLDEVNGDFRYKKVKIKTYDKPLDIDISFMKKNEEITYSTDMCIKDRLDTLKKSDFEGYKYTIANIVLAKKMLKERGLYKKHSSKGATEYGGFGGAGVETWILQNNGSFITAMKTFLEKAEKYPKYEEFMEQYPIYDFGENHKGSVNLHDSFIRGMTKQGFEEMKKQFELMLKEMQHEEESEKKLTFQQIGKETMKNYEENPQEAQDAMTLIENEIEKSKKEK